MSACFTLRSAVIRSLYSRTGCSISGTGSGLSGTGSGLSGTGSGISRTGPGLSLSVRPLCDAAAGKHQALIVESTDEYKFVERLIPPSRVPTPPRHAGPTPCGWIPPADSPPPLPYMIRRSRMHNIPVYTDLTNGNRKTTLVRKVEGDIWALEKDVKEYLTEVTGKEMPTQVNEVTMTLKVKGHFDKELKEWLAGKGF